MGKILSILGYLSPKSDTGKASWPVYHVYALRTIPTLDMSLAWSR